MCSVDFPCSSSLPSLSPFFFWVIAEPFFMLSSLNFPKRLFFLMTMSSPLSFPGFCSQQTQSGSGHVSTVPGLQVLFHGLSWRFAASAGHRTAETCFPGRLMRCRTPSPASCLYREHLGRPEPDQAGQRSQSSISTKVCPFKTFRTQRHKLPHFIK